MAFWIDTHAHLQSESYAADFEDVLTKAHAAGINTILLPGTDWPDSQLAVELATRYFEHGIIAAIGVHPHDAKTFSPQVAMNLRELALQHRGREVVAIGEIGLDYHYDFSPRDIQKQVFREQLELACDLDLPVVIHDREATADTLAIIAEVAAHRGLRDIPGVFHCFSGSVETAKIVLKHGFYLGFDGPITFKNAKKALDVLAVCPRDRVVLETDSPYLTPEPHRGHRNSPAYLPLIGARVAEVWDCSLETVAKQTTRNAQQLFLLK
ncbi:MAG: TatD family hydrolase [Eubacteriales bacterium]|nr:TatD family hydrolase [Eubacteriales bacterium]